LNCGLFHGHGFLKITVHTVYTVEFQDTSPRKLAVI